MSVSTADILTNMIFLGYGNCQLLPSKHSTLLNEINQFFIKQLLRFIEIQKIKVNTIFFTFLLLLSLVLFTLSMGTTKNTYKIFFSNK